MRSLALVCCVALGAGGLRAQPDSGAIALGETLRRIANPYRVLHIIAHPDDEDSGTVTYLSRGLGVDVTIASITRGESGANLVSNEFFDGLGVLRALEFQTAANRYGARVRFTRFADFGYSKSLEETLENWDRERVVGDLVRIIREERPHVVLSRWRGDRRDGHGHHQAAGLLAREAYEAAGDARRFPGTEPWQPLKLYLDNRRADEDWTVAIDSGVYDPLHGKTFAQLGREGMRAHRSQGAGSAIADAGPSVRYYELVASEVGGAEREDSIFERIEASVPAAVRQPARQALELYRADDPLTCVPALVEALRAARAGSLGRRQEWIEKAIALAHGAKLEFLVEPQGGRGEGRSAFLPYETATVATPGDRIRSSARLTTGFGDVADIEYAIDAPPGWAVEETAPQRYSIEVPSELRGSTVPWSRGSVWDMAYALDEERWGRALAEPPVFARASFVVGGERVELRAPLLASSIDDQRVQRRRPLVAGPAVSVELEADAGILPLGARELVLNVRLRSNASSAIRGTLHVSAPEGFEVGEPLAFALERYGDELLAPVAVRAPGSLKPGSFALEVFARYGGRESRASFRPIESLAGETAYLSRPARYEAVGVDVDVASGLRIGYLMGTGDDVPAATRQLGAEVTLLDGSALATADLSRFDSILLGIRAYAVRDDLKANNARLLEYVEQGGVLVVQYNTPEFDNNYGPYPYSMTRRPEEVSEEDSPVTILEPDDPVFRWPNAITEEDFDGWKEQRGSKFLVEWDERYMPLLETHDTGQAPQRGGWLVARHGRGLYVYCAYAWYRQLPYGVPGAVKLFANLISLGAPDAPWR